MENISVFMEENDADVEFVEEANSASIIKINQNALNAKEVKYANIPK